MKRTVLDLTGKRFGKWTVIKRADEIRIGSIMWICDCDCGTKGAILSGSNLRKGTTTSCGCLQKKGVAKRFKKYNAYDLTGVYGIGYTLKGKEFWFDLEDYDKIKEYCWRSSRENYIESSKTNKDGKIEHVSIHRIVMDAKKGEYIDHIYHDTYDNRKSQLRVVTQSQNIMNEIIRSNNKSGVKGVWYDEKNNNWLTTLTVRGKHMAKTFKNKEDAIAYRKYLEEKYHGEYALKNVEQINNNLKEVN